MSIFYTHLTKVAETYIESRPEEDLGLDYDFHTTQENLGEECYTDTGFVKIDELITKLQSFKNAGANYVACDWHCDHQELELYGVNFRVATEDEIKDHLMEIAQAAVDKKNDKIKQLESELEKLRNA
jgi:hypothetical protein